MVRRVVIGHDTQGKSVVVSDGTPPLVITNPQRPGYVSTDIWRTHATPAPIVAKPAEPTLGPRRQMPTKNGTVIRINRVMPETEDIRRMTPEQSKQVFAALGNEPASMVLQPLREVGMVEELVQHENVSLDIRADLLVQIRFVVAHHHERFGNGRKAVSERDLPEDGLAFDEPCLVEGVPQHAVPSDQRRDRLKQLRGRAARPTGGRRASIGSLRNRRHHTRA